MLKPYSMPVYNKQNKVKKAVTMLLACTPLVLLAQAVPVVAGSGSNDTMWYIIIAIMAVLMFAILLLGNVLINLAKLSFQKSSAKVVTLLLLLLVSGSIFAQNQSTAQPTGGSTLAANWNMIMALCVLVAELFILVVILLRIRAMIIELYDKKRPVMTEGHNYHSSRESDNTLSVKWKYSFYLSMLLAISCFAYYEVRGGSSNRNHDNETAIKAKQQQQQYDSITGSKVDENTVTMAGSAGIDDGKAIFATSCAPCHGQGGGGVVGPNLTDDYWLHGGSLGDVFKSIKDGWPAQGMKPWKEDLTPVQIKNVTSYIATLRGTNPPGAKAPQGDLYKPTDGKMVQSNADNTNGKSL
jgi:cytochrome c oxidase cbb3-type subunit 3